MYNLYSELVACTKTLKDLNVPVGNVTEWAVNNRAHKRLGCCYRLTNGTYKIEVNADLLKEVNPISALHDTLYHELLHTVPGCLNHGNKWQAYAAIVNKALGMNISRVCSVAEAGLIEYQPSTRKYLYEIVCPECGRSLAKFKRRSFAVDFPELYKCKVCGHEGLTSKKL